jgi:hypothetical protein
MLKTLSNENTRSCLAIPETLEIYLRPWFLILNISLFPKENIIRLFKELPEKNGVDIAEENEKVKWVRINYND